MKSVIIENPKTSQKLFNTLKRAEKVTYVDSGEISNSPLYSKTKKRKNFLNKKKLNIKSDQMILNIMQVLLMLKFQFF